MQLPFRCDENARSVCLQLATAVSNRVNRYIEAFVTFVPGILHNIEPLCTTREQLPCVGLVNTAHVQDIIMIMSNFYTLQMMWGIKIMHAL